jgi:hypothetical protein
MKAEFLIYASGLEGAALLNLNSTQMPFDNQHLQEVLSRLFRLFWQSRAVVLWYSVGDGEFVISVFLE